MAKAILICGKICSGKTVYATDLLARGRAVLLSCDELDHYIFHHALGARHDAAIADAQAYLAKKSIEVIKAGCDAILDWGFWRKADRARITRFYAENGVECEWHYIDVSAAQWQRNIDSRNRAVRAGQSTDYFIDAGLLEKLNSAFEAPDRREIDVWRASAESAADGSK